VLDDIDSYLKGEKSVLGEIGPMWTEFLDGWTKTKPEDPWWLVALKEALKFITDIEGGFDRLSRAFGGGAGSTRDFAGKLFSTVTGGATGPGGFFGGGAAGPAAAAGQLASTNSSTVKTGEINASFVINPPAGASPEAVANETVKAFSSMQNQSIREAISSQPGG
jgi:hypothetical protein